MSTPEEPPQLTRRQLRELRNTAATPIITDAPAAEEPPAAAPLPRAAEPVVVPDAPIAEPEEEDGSPSLTRRAVRQRERLRTASVPVITGEVIATPQDDEPDAGAPADAVDEEIVDADVVDAVPGDDDWSDPDATPAGADQPEDATAAEPHVEVEYESDAPAPALDDEPDADADAEAEAEPEHESSEAADVESSDQPSEPEAAPADAADTADADESEPEEERRVIAPGLGSDILRGHPVDVEVPASFDQLLTRGSTATGALSMPNALILSQTPDGGSLVSPVTATGEVLITGTFSLPDHYGSTGTVPGRSDGTDVDAVLIDGELPAASSPTPIAASAAISTIKSADEIIRPPAPEKGSRLMVVLAITAGVLAVALAGVLILAITTGVF